jgi:exodeoxyribonuclease V gamma subunit
MRSIPFRVICLIGMNDDVFPRRSSALGFDLMAQRPRPGDRSLRTDDRYIFLEAVISARERLYVSYVGQSVQDDSPIPPSVLVSELLDYVKQACGLSETAARDRLVARHRLQPFSPSYFTGDGKLYSYSREDRDACQTLLSVRRDPASFVPEPLPADEGAGEVLLEDLQYFFSNPARFLLTRRLNVRLEEYGDEVEEREPFDISGREKARMTGLLCRRALEGGDVEGLYDAFRAAGTLPHGSVGRHAFRSLLPGITAFTREVHARRSGGELSPCDLEMAVGERTLRGRVSGIWKEGLLSYRYSKATARDKLGLWIRHLALNAAGPDGYPRRSAHVASDSIIGLEPVEKAAAELEKLVRIYLRGTRELLPFFPEASLEFAMGIAKEKSPEEAVEAARKKWDPGDHGWTEARDGYFDLCFGQVDPLDEKFSSLALEVFTPLLGHMK